MSTTSKENLDERIERIRKRNEEIEKKHREAEEDRLMALKENAMVKTKTPQNDETWPKAHKFDNLDFTYDVNPEKLEEHNKQQTSKEEVKTKRDYKKFAEGEGPPPDPAYNFLADAERDGEKAEKAALGGNPQQQGFDRRGGQQNNSFRGRNVGNKPPNSNPKFQKQHSQPDYEQWRSERKRIDDARINRQKNGDKWKREWDNDKLNGSAAANVTETGMLRPERPILGETLKKSPTHPTPILGGSKSAQTPTTPTQDVRGNITVSVSQGEVKSVKLTTAPAFGTGRVGPRQMSKPQFQIQAFENEANNQVPLMPKQLRSPNQPQHQQPRSNAHSPQEQASQPRNITYPQLRQPHAQNQQSVHNAPKSPIKARKNLNATKFNASQPKEVKITTGIEKKPAGVPAEPAAGIVPPIVSEEILKELAQKPEFAKKSVQDRLLRIRQNPTEPPKDDGGKNSILACN